jgi:serine/threonine-protein kinase
MLKSFLRLTIFSLSFIVIGVIAIFLVFKLINFSSTAKVPLLIGKSVSDAALLLKDRGLSLETQGEDYHADIPQGFIVTQDIQPGERIEKGSSVKVGISKGKATFVVPYLEGMDVDDVKLTLLNAGMEIGKTTWVHSDSQGKNRIIAQRPLPGYSDNNKVNLLVSLGSYEVSYKCPSFVKMTVDEARIMAKNLGLELIEKENGNMVMFQKPEAGSIIKKGESVEITLGRGGGFWF